MCHRSKSTMLLMLALILALAACAPAATLVPPTSTPIPPTNTIAPTTTAVSAPRPVATTEVKSVSADLDAMMQKITDKGLFTGAVLVARDGQIVLNKGYGFADRERKILNMPQTQFRIAQVTQSFTAVAILLLQKQGKLSITDKICRYLKACPIAWQDITIQQLLTHTAGLPEIIDTDAYRLIQGEPTTPQKLIALFRDAPLDYLPGKSFNITPLGFGASDYVVLGALIEQISGQTFETFVQQAVLEPLTLTHTSFDQAVGERAIGYFDQTSIHTVPHRVIPYAAGSLYSTVEDLYRWMNALAGDGPISTLIVDEVLKPQIKNPTGNGWDAGYSVILDTFAGRRTISLSGDMDGYRSVIDWYPDERLMIIVLVNQDTVSPFTTSELLAKKALDLK